jgi:hypothetical protein
MALTERMIIDLVEVLETGVLQVREATIIEKDGVEITRTFYRYVASPGDDITNADPKIQNIANAVWTPEVIAAYQASQENNPV